MSVEDEPCRIRESLEHRHPGRRTALLCLWVSVAFPTACCSVTSWWQARIMERITEYLDVSTNLERWGSRELPLLSSCALVGPKVLRHVVCPRSVVRAMDLGCSTVATATATTITTAAVHAAASGSSACGSCISLLLFKQVHFDPCISPLLLHQLVHLCSRSISYLLRCHVGVLS